MTPSRGATGSRQLLRIFLYSALVVAAILLLGPASAWTGTSSGGGNYNGKDVAGSGTLPLVYGSGSWSTAPTGTWSSIDIACAGCGGTDVTSSVPAPTNGGNFGGPFPMGFSFSYFGQTQNQAWVQGYGYIEFGAAQPPKPSNTDAWNQLDKDVNSGTDSGTPNYVIQLFSNNRACYQYAPGKIFTKQIAASPAGANNAVFVLQFDGWKFWNGCGGGTGGQNWIQARFYQTSNVIEIHYKQVDNNDPFGGHVLDAGIRGSGATQYLRYTPYYSSSATWLTDANEVVQYRPSGVLPTIAADSYALNVLLHGPTLFVDGAPHTVGSQTQPASTRLTGNDKSVASASFRANYVAGSLKNGANAVIEATASLRPMAGGICTGTSPSVGTDGTFCFTPPAGPNPCADSPYSFQYTVTDAWGTTAPVTATLGLANCDNPPLVFDDPHNVVPGGIASYYQATEDTPLAVTDVPAGSVASCTVTHGLLCNDSDPDAGETATLTVDTDTLTIPSLGTLADIDATHTRQKGAFRFTPSANACGPTSFEYKARDVVGVDSTETATVYINIQCANDAPTASAGTSVGVEDTALPITLGAADPDLAYGDGLSYCMVTPPSHGTLGGFPTCASGLTQAATSVMYTPAADYCNGTPSSGFPYQAATSDAFTFRVADVGGTTSDATHRVDVLCINDDPVAVDDFETSLQDSLFADNVWTIMANDEDADSPDAADPHAPLATVQPAGWYTLSILSVGAPDHAGSQSQCDAGCPATAASYQPAAAWAGADQFVYTLQDEVSPPAQATVYVDVLFPDPHAVLDVVAATEDTLFIAPACASGEPAPTNVGGPYRGVLCNDVDESDHVVRAILVSTPSSAIGPGGLFAWNSNNDGGFAYRARNDYCNIHTGGTPDVFQYLMHDETQDMGINTVQVRLQVACSNDPPAANGGSITLTEDVVSPVTLSASDVDLPFGDQVAFCFQPYLPPALVASGGAVPSCGSWSAFTPGSITTYLTPASNACTTSPVPVTIQVRDLSNGVATATLQLSITCAADPPSGVSDEYRVALGHTLSTAARLMPSVIANDLDPDSPYGNPSLQVVQVCSPPAVGGASSLSMDLATGHFHYTPVGASAYQDSFTYRVGDAGGQAAAACTTVALDVQPDQAPIAAFAFAPNPAMAAVPVHFVDLSHDPDADDAVTGWVWTFGDGSGSSQRNPNHAFGATGSYTVCLLVFDGWGVSGKRVCQTLQVTGAPAADPLLDAQTAPQEMPGLVQEGGLDEAFEVDAGVVQTVGPGASVTLTGTVAGHPNARFSWMQRSGSIVEVTGALTASPSFTAPLEAGFLVFRLTAYDGVLVGHDDVTVFVSDVAAHNDAPVAVARLTTAPLAAGVELDGRDSSDPDGDVLSYAWTQLDGPAGTITQEAVGRATMRLPPDAAGRDIRVLLSVSDGLASASAVIAFKVEPDNSLTLDTGGFVIKGSGLKFTVTPNFVAEAYAWDFGDGKTVTSTGPVTHTYADAGTYTITLTAQDAAGTPLEFEGEADATLRDASRAGDASAGVPWLPVLLVAAVVLALAGAAILILRRGAIAPEAP